MAKKINEETLKIEIILHRDGGSGLVEVYAQADYTVESTDGLSTTRSKDITLSEAQKNTIKTFGANVLSQVKAAENIS